VGELPPAADVQPQPGRLAPSPVEPLPYAGFWARGAAAVLDVLLLMLIGYVIGFAGAPLWGRMGPPAVWVGFALTVAYWGLTNSIFRDGQSLGKRVFLLRVVDARGEPPAVVTGLLRAAVLALPFYLRRSGLGQPGPSDMLQALAGGQPTVAMTAYAALGTSLFALAALQVYLALLNLPARRCLHDLILGTYVVRDDAQGPPPVRRLALVHVPVLLALAATLIAVTIHLQGTGQKVARQASALDDIGAAIGAVMELPGVRLASADSMHYEAPIMGNKDADWLSVQAAWRGMPRPSREAAADEVARAVFRSCAAADKADMVVVRITWGWTLGLSSFSWYYNARYPPARWRERLKRGPIPRASSPGNANTRFCAQNRVFSQMFTSYVK
jgi:uncharacterized RDD family membrane protein YckC